MARGVLVALLALCAVASAKIFFEEKFEDGVFSGRLREEGRGLLLESSIM